MSTKSGEDHDDSDGAAVRISMTVGQGGERDGRLLNVIGERNNGDLGLDVELAEKAGRIQSDLTVGADISSAQTLKANERISNRGMQLISSGFIVTPTQAAELGLGSVTGLERHIRLYRNGRDLTQAPRQVMAIDLFGLSEREVRKRYPEVYQWVLERVKPERDHNNRAAYRDNWWIFGEPRALLRPALVGLARYIATVETAKHRFFTFLDQSILPDNMLVNIALDDAYFLGVLSSSPHVAWALAQGGTLEDRPRYNKTRCFETFPFPDPPEALKARIRDLGERLDAHRKRQQELHPDLTMTGMYNVLEKLRVGQELSAKERLIHEQGLVSVLMQIHDELDAAVFEAYGWPPTLSDEEILERLVALNKERAAEEAQGLVRWLRPEYQAPSAQPQVQGELAGMAAPAQPAHGPAEKQPWPTALAAQAQAVRQALEALAAPADVATVAKCFSRAPRARVAELLETLAGLGQARVLEAGRYAGR